jgi:hypothetical protein
MNDQEKTIAPLPESFENEEQAGAFWDTHSTMDYLNYLEGCDEAVDSSEHLLALGSANTASE